MNRKMHWSHRLAPLRKVVHPVLSATIAFGVMVLQWNLLWIVAVGSFLGLFGGKLFCRWACPMGYMMEKVVAGTDDETARAQLSYYKMGCPIAWVSGIANRFSLFKIRREKEPCTDCGICDKACYISALDSTQSLYREGAKDPAKSYACSKCFTCVEACPAGALKVE